MGVDAVFMCKSDRALPYISAGHRSTSWLNRIRSAILNVPIRSNHGRTISVRRWPVSIDSSGIIAFQDDNPPKLVTTSPPVKPDVLILATGYNTSFPFLCPSSAYPSLPSATTRGIYCPSDPTVSFIGFVRPSIGAIPPLAELQAQLWTLRLLQHIYPPSLVARTRSPDAVPPYELDWRLRPRAGYDLWTDKRGVDHESYAYQLALDMGAAPTVGFVVRRGWRVAYTWAMGSNFNTKFRLVGPWAERETAEAVMRGELYGVVKRSGGVVCKCFRFFSLPPLSFGPSGGDLGIKLTGVQRFSYLFDNPSGLLRNDKLDPLRRLLRRFAASSRVGGYEVVVSPQQDGTENRRLILPRLQVKLNCNNLCYSPYRYRARRAYWPSYT